MLREGSKHWVKHGENAPRRPKTQQSAGKVGNLWLVFLVITHGVIFIKYLKKGRTISGVYYAASLGRLVDEIRKKRPHLKKEKIVFHYDNFEGFDESYYLEGIKKLKDRWTRRIDLKRGYIEK